MSGGATDSRPLPRKTVKCETNALVVSSTAGRQNTSGFNLAFAYILFLVVGADGGKNGADKNGAARIGFERIGVRRIWHAHGLKPHLVRTFKLSRVPEFTIRSG